MFRIQLEDVAEVSQSKRNSCQLEYDIPACRSTDFEDLASGFSALRVLVGGVPSPMGVPVLGFKTILSLYIVILYTASQSFPVDRPFMM